jgi:hypothetical protein
MHGAPYIFWANLTSFSLQAKVAKDADTTQRDIERAQEENARLEGKAEMSLGRIRDQQSLLIRPFWSEINTLLGSMGYMMKDLDFPLMLGENIRVGVVFSQLSASPHIKHIVQHSLHNNRLPFFKLLDNEVTELRENDEEKRSRYTSWNMHSIVPAWQTLDSLGKQLSHLLEPVPYSPMIDIAFCRGFGDEWGSVLKMNPMGGTGPGGQMFPSVLVAHARTHASEWAAVLSNWASGNYSILQPESPAPLNLLFIHCFLMIGAVSKKEIEMTGASATATSAARNFVAALGDDST